REMIRSVSASAGVDWLKNAINLGRGNPRALFGGAALAVVAMVVLMFALGIVQGLLLAGFGSAGAMVAGMAVTMVAVVVVVSMLLVGFLRLVDDVENGRPTSAGRVFAGFGDLGASLRVIGFTLVLTLLQYAVLGLLLAVLARDALGWYARMMTMSDPTTMDPAMLALPDGIALAMVVTVVVGLVMYGVQAIGACPIAPQGRGVVRRAGLVCPDDDDVRSHHDGPGDAGSAGWNRPGDGRHGRGRAGDVRRAGDRCLPDRAEGARGVRSRR